MSMYGVAFRPNGTLSYDSNTHTGSAEEYASSAYEEKTGENPDETVFVVNFRFYDLVEMEKMSIISLFYLESDGDYAYVWVREDSVMRQVTRTAYHFLPMDHYDWTGFAAWDRDINMDALAEMTQYVNHIVNAEVAWDEL